MREPWSLPVNESQKGTIPLCHHAKAAASTSASRKISPIDGPPELLGGPLGRAMQSGWFAPAGKPAWKGCEGCYRILQMRANAAAR